MRSPTVYIFIYIHSTAFSLWLPPPQLVFFFFSFGQNFLSVAHKCSSDLSFTFLSIPGWQGRRKNEKRKTGNRHSTWRRRTWSNHVTLQLEITALISSYKRSRNGGNVSRIFTRRPEYVASHFVFQKKKVSKTWSQKVVKHDMQKRKRRGEKKCRWWPPFSITSTAPFSFGSPPSICSSLSAGSDRSRLILQFIFHIIFHFNGEAFSSRR